MIYTTFTNIPHPRRIETNLPLTYCIEPPGDHPEPFVTFTDGEALMVCKDRIAFLLRLMTRHYSVKFDQTKPLKKHLTPTLRTLYKQTQSQTWRIWSWAAARAGVRRIRPGRLIGVPLRKITVLFLHWHGRVLTFPFSLPLSLYPSILRRVCQDCRAWSGQQVTLAGRCSDQDPLKRNYIPRIPPWEGSNV